MNKLIQIISYAMIAFSGFWGAKFVWTFVDQPNNQLVTSVDTAQTKNTVNSGIDKTIVSASLFGTYKEPVRTQQAQPTQAPQPTKPPVVNLPPLGFKLAGPVANIGAHIAQGPRQNSKWFRIGDDVFGRGKLIKVTDNTVVIDRNGQHEELIFDNTKGGTAGLGPSISDMQVSNEMAGSVISGIEEPEDRPEIERPANIGRGNGRGATFNPMGRTDPIVTPAPKQEQDEPPKTMAAAQRMVENIVSQAKANPNDVLIRYGLQATNGGYRVTSNAILLMGVGMRPGDLIVEVNDMKVGNPAADAGRIDQVIASGQIKVEFVRGGQRMQISSALAF